MVKSKSLYGTRRIWHYHLHVLCISELLVCNLVSGYQDSPAFCQLNFLDRT